MEFTRKDGSSISIGIVPLLVICGTINAVAYYTANVLVRKKEK